ncbi:MAG: hypothetical protein JSR67_02465 [Proteobacteria bacterium]|nr:hypothetical protein [Pseudomonadota bacterium]
MNTNLRPPPSAPSSSRMLTGYLTDIEQLLDEQRWQVALREAADLPLIAAALTDPQMRSTREGVRSWCRVWLNGGSDDDRIDRQIRKLHPVDATAASALRRLRLRRELPPRPRGFSTSQTPDLAPQDSEAAEACVALVNAARRWYARSACHDPEVQSNLARLAVLR